MGLSALEDVLEVETRGDEVLFWFCLEFELLLIWLRSFETTIFVEVVFTESEVGLICELSSSSPGISDSICVSSLSSFPRELECDEFEDPTKK